jgi:hypothetical protein
MGANPRSNQFKNKMKFQTPQKIPKKIYVEVFNMRNLLEVFVSVYDARINDKLQSNPGNFETLGEFGGF